MLRANWTGSLVAEFCFWARVRVLAVAFDFLGLWSYGWNVWHFWYSFFVYCLFSR